MSLSPENKALIEKLQARAKSIELTHGISAERTLEGQAVAALLARSDPKPPVEGGGGEGMGSARADLSRASSSPSQHSAGWRDISTAPRDETEILVFFQPIRGRLSGVHQVAWINQNGTTTPEEGIWCVDDNKHGPYAMRGYLDGDDTHWMPLPPPPGQEGSADSDGGDGVPVHSLSVQAEPNTPSPTPASMEEIEEALRPFAEAWLKFDPSMAYTTAPYLFVQRSDFRKAQAILSRLHGVSGEGMEASRDHAHTHNAAMRPSACTDQGSET